MTDRWTKLPSYYPSLFWPYYFHFQILINTLPFLKCPILNFFYILSFSSKTVEMDRTITCTFDFNVVHLKKLHMYQVWSHCYTVIGMKRCLNILTTKNDNRQQCNGIKYCLPCKTRKPLLILHNEYWEIPYDLVGIRTVRLSGDLFSMMIHPKEHRPPFTLYLNSNLL